MLPIQFQRGNLGLNSPQFQAMKSGQSPLQQIGQLAKQGSGGPGIGGQIGGAVGGAAGGYFGGLGGAMIGSTIGRFAGDKIIGK